MYVSINGGCMKIQLKTLITGLLVFSLTAGMLLMPAGAAVRNDSAQNSAAETGKMNGPSVSSESFITESTAAQTPVDVSGATWKKVGSYYRLQSSNGSYKTGFVKHNGKTYFFDSKGNMKVGFFTTGGKKYYASYIRGDKGKGQIMTGLVGVGGYYYYLNPSSSPHKGVVAAGFQKINGRRYYFNSQGRMLFGWLTVNGSKYYASCNVNKHYGALLTGNQQIGSKYYKFDANGKLLGQITVSSNSGKASSKYAHMIDVSEHQGSIDFNKVKAAGVKAVIIRAGYGSSTTDKYFYQNIKNAKAAGLTVGIYWFSYAANTKQAVNEAKRCMAVIKPFKIDLPVFFDWEYDSMRYTKVKSRSKITDMTAAFCSTITSGGYRAGYYFNLHYLNSYYNPSKLTKYATWYAYWGTNRPSSAVWTHADTMTTPTQYDMWQFTSRGKINGIKGYVDCDLLLDPSIRK